MEKRALSYFRQTQQGSAMMETVVSLFVLAVGLLGTLAMQAQGVNSNQRANFVTEANILAADMVDRILAYNNIDTDTFSGHSGDYNGLDTLSESASAPDCSAGCPLADQVVLDTAQWGDALAQNLPNGSGKISFDDANNTYTIQIFWDHNHTGATGRGCSGDDQGEEATDLTCYTYQLRI